MDDQYKARILSAVADVVCELHQAVAMYPRSFVSAHEGYAIIHEEMDELWECVRQKQGGGRDVDSMHHEAIQVAAMAIRFAIDICDGGKSQE